MSDIFFEVYILAIPDTLTNPGTATIKAVAEPTEVAPATAQESLRPASEKYVSVQTAEKEEVILKDENKKPTFHQQALDRLSAFGWVNLDEFDRLSNKRMAQLKRIMQMVDLDYRPPSRSTTSLSVPYHLRKNFCAIA